MFQQNNFPLTVISILIIYMYKTKIYVQNKQMLLKIYIKQNWNVTQQNNDINIKQEKTFHIHIHLHTHKHTHP